MIKAAVIGVGSMGFNHVRVYADIEGVDLVAIAEPSAAAARRATHIFGLKRYDDYRELLDRERPDVVSVVVPTQHHAEVACEAMDRGIHVLIEKPIAFTREEGLRMIERSAMRQVKLMVGHVERFNPAILEMKRRLQQGALGRVFQVHARRLSPFPGRIQDVGVVLDLATRDIDAIRFLVGGDVERVYAEIERRAHTSREDMLSGLMRFQDGVIGVLDVNWLTPTKVRQLSVTGEGGMFLADYLTQDLHWYKNGRVADSWDALEVFRGASEGDVIKLHVAKKEPLRAEVEAFIEAVRNDSKPQVSGEDGLAALELAGHLVASGRTHAPVFPQGTLAAQTL